MATILRRFQNQMFEFAARKLDAFSRNPGISPEAFYQGYHALIFATYIDPEKAEDPAIEMNKSLAPKSWLADRAVARQCHLLNDEGGWEKYRDWLLKCLLYEEMSKEKERYIGYMVGYFGGFEKANTDQFILSQGRFIPSAYDIPKIIKEHYQNSTETLYRRSPILMDINFLRLALLISTLPSLGLPASSKNCLIQTCERTLDFCDHVNVRAYATRLLRELKQASR